MIGVSSQIILQKTHILIFIHSATTRFAENPPANARTAASRRSTSTYIAYVASPSRFSWWPESVGAQQRKRTNTCSATATCYAHKTGAHASQPSGRCQRTVGIKRRQSTRKSSTIQNLRTYSKENLSIEKLHFTR